MSENTDSPTASPSPLLALAIITRGRLPELRRAVNSAIAYAGAPIYVAVFFDDDAEGYRAYDTPPGVEKYLLSPRHYYVRAINCAYEHLKSIGADIVAFSNNDSEFVAHNWAHLAKQALYDSFPDGLGICEFSADAGKCAHFATRAPFVEEFLGGRIAEPSYMHYFSDTELLHRVEKQLGRYVHMLDLDNQRPGLLIQHTMYDSVRQEGRQWYNRDRDIWQERQVALYSDGEENDVEPS